MTDSYDAWKSNAPDPGSGGMKTPAQLLRRNYAFAARQNDGTAFLDQHRHLPELADAIANIEADPDWFCQRHGQPRIYDPYWSAMSGGCSECEPSDADGESFRGGESAAYDRDQMADARRLK